MFLNIYISEADRSLSAHSGKTNGTLVSSNMLLQSLIKKKQVDKTVKSEVTTDKKLTSILVNSKAHLGAAVYNLSYSVTFDVFIEALFINGRRQALNAKLPFQYRIQINICTVRLAIQRSVVLMHC